MTDLIERLMQAKGPDRDLDAAVHRACVGEVWTGALSGHWYPDGKAEIPSYTRSQDDAMTLVDESAGLRIERYWLRRPEPAWRAMLFTGGVPGNPARQFVAEDCYTAGCAISAAALKARASQNPPERG